MERFFHLVDISKNLTGVKISIKYNVCLRVSDVDIIAESCKKYLTLGKNINYQPLHPGIPSFTLGHNGGFRDAQIKHILQAILIDEFISKTPDTKCYLELLTKT